MDHQLGSEARPDCLGWARGENCAERDWASACHVCRMVLVFREVRRVLRNDGVMFLNYGDSYVSSPKGNPGSDSFSSRPWSPKGGFAYDKTDIGLPSGNLVGVPWRVALALQADGWVLRSDMPWVKRAAMPESVTSRPAKALEYVFLLTKSMDYYFDMTAIRRSDSGKRSGNKERTFDHNVNGDQGVGHGVPWEAGSGRNFRNADLWFSSVESPHGVVGVGDELVGLDVTPQGYPGAHFATFGPRLIEPMILAGTSAKGACARCGAPWQRVVDSVSVSDWRDRQDNSGENGYGRCDTGGPVPSIPPPTTTTTGWRPTCSCSAATVPCVVMDPFIGSGTAVAVAIKHGRRGIGIDLSETYLRDHAIKRIGAAMLEAREVREENLTEFLPVASAAPEQRAVEF